MAGTGGRVSERWLGEAALRLLLSQERCGLEIADRLLDAYRHETGEQLRLAEGSVYATLRRLEHGGLIAGKWVAVGEGRPRRRYYALSPKGRRVATARRVARPGTSQVSTWCRS